MDSEASDVAIAYEDSDVAIAYEASGVAMASEDSDVGMDSEAPLMLDEALAIRDLFKEKLYKQHTEEQVEEIRKVFTMFDQFANLMMPLKHVPTGLRALGQLLTEDDVKHIMDEFAEAGKVHFSTFCSLVARRPWGMEGTRAELKSSFVNAFHLHKTRWLDRKVFQRVLTTSGEKVTEEEVNGLLALCETTIDGEVNFEAMIDKLME